MVTNYVGEAGVRGVWSNPTMKMMSFNTPTKTLGLKNRTQGCAFNRVAIACLLAMAGCGTPTARVEVVPSDKPITINLNVKIDHEVRVKVEEELDEVLSKDSRLF